MSGENIYSSDPRKEKSYLAAEKLAEAALRKEYEKEVIDFLQAKMKEVPRKEDVEVVLQSMFKKMRENGTLKEIIDDYFQEKASVAPPNPF